MSRGKTPEPTPPQSAPQSAPQVSISDSALHRALTLAPDRPYTALGVAGANTLVGTPIATVIVWLLDVYVRPKGQPIPSEIAALLGGGLAGVCTYGYHLAQLVLDRWTAKLTKGAP